MINNFYVPIDSISLPSIYGNACLMPKKYLSTTNEDVQNTLPSYLLITTKMGTDKSDCAIEIALSEEEINSLIPISEDNDVFLYSKPLPISRIKSVSFNNKANKEQIIAIINISTAFIDNDKVNVVLDMQKVNLDAINIADIPENLDFSLQLNKFNGILGGFALMKLASEEYMNYSENYFSTLSFFNTQIEKDLLNSGISINKKFHDAFLGIDKFKALYPLLSKTITESDILNSANIENQTVIKDKYTGIIDIDSFENMTYILCVLFTYRVGNEAGGRKIDTLIANNFKNSIKEDKSEIVALCYGINRGYSSFTKKYSVDGKENDVKFKLNKKLDYYTIESLYQFAFNNINSSSSFKYLDDWCPILNETIKKGSYKIIDEIVIIKKKPKVGTKDYLSQLSRLFFQKNIEDFLSPFLNIIINKVKDDLETETKEIIESKEKEIEELRSKLKETVKQEKFKEYKNKKIKQEINIQEPSEKFNPDESKNSIQKNDTAELDNLKNLLNKIEKLKNAAEIQKIIKENKKSPDLFNPK